MNPGETNQKFETDRIHTGEIINTFLELNEGENAKRLIGQIKRLVMWLDTLRPQYVDYRNLIKIKHLAYRKPHSDQVMALQLDATPEISQMKLGAQKFYQALEKAEGLNLTKAEKAELLSSIEHWCEVIGEQVPPLQRILQPDSSYNLPKENLPQEPAKTEFNLAEIKATLSHISTLIDNSFHTKYPKHSLPN